MPLKRCSEGKMSGWKWGDQGKCYKSKKDAIKQGYAENADNPKKFEEEIKHGKSDFTTSELLYAKNLLNGAEKVNTRGDFAEKVKAAFEEMDPTKAYIPAKTRKEIPDDDFAGPHKSYPIRNDKDVRDAAELLHHAANPAEVKKNITRIAKKKGLSLPATWSHEEEEEKK
jgi:hypothetical protein